MDLADFLVARIEEDEGFARDAVDDGHDWRGRGEHDPPVARGPGARRRPPGLPPRDPPRHATMWSPARVLQECAAKRFSVEDYRAALTAHRTGWDVCSPRDYARRALAVAYADHPDFPPEWRL